MSDDETMRAVLENVRPEIREEVAYAIQLATAACAICDGTGRATWLDDCEECAAAIRQAMPKEAPRG